MITTFQDNLASSGFYLPSDTNPEGRVQKGGTNFGGENRVKNFKEYFEYRKGSDKFGNLINRLMEFLRLPEFSKKIDENDGLKFKIQDFEKRANISVDEIKKLISGDNNLYSFDIDIDDKYISFSNINNTYKNRYVSGRKD